METSLFSYRNLLLGGVFVYALHYLFFIVKKPKVHCNEKQLAFLKKNVPILFEKFWPTFYFLDARLQTLFRDFFIEPKETNYIRELLTLPDKEVIAMDWSENFYSSSENKDQNVDDARPIIIVLPGLVGTSRDTYAKRIAHKCSKLAYRCVVLNYRGSAGMELVNNKPYCATDYEDLDYAVGFLHDHHPNNPLMLVGISLGGVIATNYVASKGTNNKHYLTCVMAISIGWDFIISNRSLASPLNYQLFNKYLLGKMIHTAKKHKEKFSKYVDIETVCKSKSIMEFDNNFTSRIYGFANAREYYIAASAHDKVHDIKVPYLNLNAQDDPFAPIKTLPVKDASESENVTIVVTKKGGHIGFVDSVFKGQKEGYYERVFGQYATAMLNTGNKVKDT